MGDAHALGAFILFAELGIVLVQVEEGVQVTSHVFFDGIADNAGLGQCFQRGGSVLHLLGSAGGLAGQPVLQGRPGGALRGGFHLFHCVGQSLAGLRNMAFQQQRMAQTVVDGVQHPLMMAAKALLVHLDAGIGLHHGCAQIMIHLAQLRLALEGAKEAFAVQLDGVPHGNGVDMVLHAIHVPS